MRLLLPFVVVILALTIDNAIHATLTLDDILALSKGCLAERIGMNKHAIQSLEKSTTLSADVKKAEQARYQMFIDSIDENFLKCGVWSWTLEDFKKAAVSASFFLTSEKKTPKAEKDEDVEGVLKCVRSKIANRPFSSKITQTDADRFKENFGDGTSKLENEALLGFLRTLLCSGRKFDPNAEDPFKEMQKSLPQYYWGRLKAGYWASYDWADCMVKMKFSESIEFSDMWGCNGHWDFWNGPACLERLKEKKPDSVPEGLDDAKFRNVIQGDAEAATSEVASPASQDQNSSGSIKKSMLNMARKVYRDGICAWSKTNSNAKLAAAEKAAKQQTQGKRVRRATAHQVKCFTAIAATFIFATMLALYAAGVFGTAGSVFGCGGEFGVMAACVSFLVGFMTGIILTISGGCYHS